MQELAIETRVVLAGEIPGFLESPCEFELTIHGDGSLTGTVSSTEGDDDANTYSLFDGQAIAREHVDLYRVKFQLTRLSDLPGLVYYIDVEAELSLCDGLHGRWNVAGSLSRPDALDPDRPIHLPVCADRYGLTRRGDVAEAKSHGMYPLTQGSYTLRGAAIGDNGYLYRAQWQLTLQADGVLLGTSREDDNAPQLCRLVGSWTRTRICLELTYVVDGEVGTYSYEGDVCDSGLRGRWVNSRDAESKNERGKFEFACVDATRRWNIHDHCQYPAAFREAVRVCLLSSLRPSDHHARLPCLVWREVFAFCAFEWFASAK